MQGTSASTSFTFPSKCRVRLFRAGDRIISQQLENNSGIEARITVRSVAARHLSSLGSRANSKLLWYGEMNFYTICSLLKGFFAPAAQLG